MEIKKSSFEVSPNIHRLCVAPNEHFEFAQFLLLDESPCLIHTGKSTLFEPLFEMALDVLKSQPLKYIVFSHVEADESGAVNKWLEKFPEAQVICNKIANISLDDSLIRPARVIRDGEKINLGHMSLQMIETPHFPHNWDAHLWFEEKNKILFSSDFCCQGGLCEPLVESDISQTITEFYEKGRFMPYGATTNSCLEKLDKIPFQAIAPMHGSMIAGGASRVVFDKVKADLISRS